MSVVIIGLSVVFGTAGGIGGFISGLFGGRNYILGTSTGVLGRTIKGAFIGAALGGGIGWLFTGGTSSPEAATDKAPKIDFVANCGKDIAPGQTLASVEKTPDGAIICHYSPKAPAPQ
jgi:hypothetical protein